MKTSTWTWIPPAGALLAFGCSGTRDVRSEKGNTSTTAQSEDDEGEEVFEEDEEVVALDQVPEAVKQAARDAVPGIVLVEAEREGGESGIVYCVHGRAAGEFVEVEVDPSGKVLEIERGDDEGDED
jgi:hypothetical protein